MHSLQRLGLIFGGIIFALALYVLPDMLMNLGESPSGTLKAVVTIVLLIPGAILRRKMPALATFMISSGLVLSAFLWVGCWIRLSELRGG